jgi:hypothetical protein
MRGSWMWAVGAAAGLLLVLAQPAVSGHAGCATQAGMQDASRHTKPSSFEPHARPPGNAYGMPIGDKILSKRVKKKPPAARPARSDALA